MICFSWIGFPQYAARCIRALVHSTNEEICVIATTPSVPIKGMDEIASCKVFWVSEDDNRSITEIIGEVPRVFFACGWGTPFINRLRDEVRSENKIVAVTCDNNFVLGYKLILQYFRFKLFFRNKYNAFFVPGNSGRRLMRFYGISQDKIFKGLYSADGSIFESRMHLPERPKRILYVGQFCDRKNVLMLCKAFLELPLDVRSGWKLELCGNGPLREHLPIDQDIIVHDFVQPEELSKIYQRSRIFVLPSKEEHWGLVVHEAALSGCYLILGEEVGAREDLLQEDINGVLVDPHNKSDLSVKLVAAMSLSSDRLHTAEKKSIELAKKISVENFVKSVKAISLSNS